jgi:hypothetical protein
MAYLIVEGVTVPVDVKSTPSREIDYARDEESTFDNLPCMAQTGVDKNVWKVVTSPMSLSDAATLEAALANIPATCSGDLLGASTECFPTITSVDDIAVGGGYKRILSFTLKET